MLTELIDDALLKAQTPRKREYFYASDCGKCPRALFMEFFPDIYRPEPATAKLLRVFDNGNSVHERICKYFNMAGILKDKEVSIRGDGINEDIHGRCDCIINLEGEEQVVELKSTNAFSDAFLPQDGHVSQLMFYLHFMKKKRGWLFYETKGSQVCYEYPVVYDADRAAAVLKYFADVREAVAGAKLLRVKTEDSGVAAFRPPVPEGYVPSAYPCSWCSLKAACAEAAP